MSFLKKRSKPMLGQGWKDAISLAEVLNKDRSCCLEAKEGLGICHTSTLPQASHRAGMWLQGSRTPLVLGLQYTHHSNTGKKIELEFFNFFCKTSSLLKRGSVETPFQQEKSEKAACNSASLKSQQGLIWPVELTTYHNHKS